MILNVTLVFLSFVLHNRIILILLRCIIYKCERPFNTIMWQ